jgi:hypothetical protein
MTRPNLAAVDNLRIKAVSRKKNASGCGLFLDDVEHLACSLIHETSCVELDQNGPARVTHERASSRSVSIYNGRASIPEE